MLSHRGAGGHFLVVIPERDMVVVHRVDTFEGTNNVTAGDFGRLLQMILDARVRRHGVPGGRREVRHPRADAHRDPRPSDPLSTIWVTRRG